MDKLKKREQKLATVLGEHINRLSISKKKWLLAIFCLGFSMANIAVIGNALRGSSQDTATIEPIRLPAGAGKTGEPRSPPKSLPSGVVEQVQTFRRYLDSLRSTPAGRLTYDSLTKARPGLFDSLALLENIIQQEK